MRNEEVVEIAKKWKDDPGNLDKYMEMLADFQSSIFREKDPQVFGQNLISYLIMEYTIYNTTEENYFDEVKTDEVFTALAEALADSYKNNGNRLNLPEPYKKFFMKLKETVGDYPLYTREITLPQYDDIKVKIMDPYRGKNRVSSKKSTFLVDIDTIFSDPLRAKKLLPKIDNVINELEKFDKFCFIEKRKGPVGPSALMALFTSKYKKPSAIYRPRHLTPLARVSGDRIEKGDKLCMVYDLSFSGEGLKEAALELKRAFRAEPKYAVVIADLKSGAKELLEDIGVTLKPIFEFSEKEIKDIWYNKYGSKLEEKIL